MPIFRRQHGFTLTELVIVLVILGILSAMGIGMFASSGSYSTLLARDQFIASSLLAQKRALANTDASNSVTLSIQQTTTQWQFRIQHGSVQYTDRTADRKNGQLLINGTAASATQTYTFDRRGRIGSSAQLSFTGNSIHQACLASTGFAYTGTCEP